MYILQDVCVRGVRSNHTKSFKAKNKNEKREKIMDTIGGKETNKDFRARHRIFGVWPRSRGSALIDCLTHHAGGTPLW